MSTQRKEPKAYGQFIKNRSHSCFGMVQPLGVYMQNGSNQDVAKEILVKTVYICTQCTGTTQPEISWV